ncbi:MAG: WGR domain-containing protein [Candidatus Lokiarchaeota archaeon]|nr:WGR domain-containing protein [Candidatus Lokiarchaeota archaeon]
MSETKTVRYINKTTNQFWSAQVHGKAVTIRFGRIGTRGHQASREFSNHQAAIDFLQKRLADKKADGFVPEE